MKGELGVALPWHREPCLAPWWRKGRVLSSLSTSHDPPPRWLHGKVQTWVQTPLSHWVFFRSCHASDLNIGTLVAVLIEREGGGGEETERERERERECERERERERERECVCERERERESE